MKRAALLILVALAVSGLMFRDRWLAYLPASLGVRSVATGYLGYVEGETILIAAPLAGRLVEVPLQRGGQAKKGAVAFRLDAAEADAAVAQFDAALVDAKAQLDNLKTGKRAVEQDIVRAQRQETEAALSQAERDWERATSLSRSGVVARATLDQAASQVRQLRARVAQFKAQEAAGALGGRTAEVRAAEARLAEVKAQRDQALSRQRDRAPLVPETAEVEDVYFRAGEWVAAGQPVVALLPPGKLKLRFFVPEDKVSELRPGSVVAVRCDGCGPDMPATVTFVSPRAEFTPPVIYSQTARQKLVFLVEARPEGNARQLRPGLPVEVAPAPGGLP